MTDPTIQSFFSVKEEGYLKDLGTEFVNEFADLSYVAMSINGREGVPAKGLKEIVNKLSDEDTLLSVNAVEKDRSIIVVISFRKAKNS